MCAEKVDVVERNAVTVACMRRTGAYGPGIATFWRQTVAGWLEKDGLLGRHRYGISLDNPGITPPEQCRYDAGVEVTPDYVASGDVHKTTLPAGLYAQYHFYGTPAQIGEAWHDLMENWLPGSGYRIAGPLPYEYVPADARFDTSSGAFECLICLPVAKG